ncbi:putative MO25-like protein At5g47540 [Coffea arabica]|uniref:MO25-like protein At5g47540 n=1 Tax=Coffea arabica TaxID=13443 RepID=A0A6P6W6I1_COFAR|nr:putative MO25-like protein At5g47540 [Coffea arabica]
MKGVLFFKSKPKATPADLVRQTRDLLSHVNSAPNTFQSQSQSKRQVNMINTIGKLLEDLKLILYGDSDTQPVASACAQLTEEFFREDTLCLLIICLPKLKLETRKDATLLVSNLLRQKVRSRFIACDYLEQNLELIDVLVGGYENNGMEITALHYGSMLRDCIRHQDLARHVLESKLMMKKFFDYVQVARYEVAADATETFKQLLTRHKSTVAEFLSKNYDWFFVEYNSKLLQSPNYLTRREAVKLLGEMLMHRSNSDVMLQYVSSRDNLRIFMNLLRDSSKIIQVDALRIFKLFAANENKTPEIVGILVANRNKLLQLLFAELKIDNNGDPQLQADKAQVVKDIFALDVKVKA